MRATSDAIPAVLNKRLQFSFEEGAEILSLSKEVLERDARAKLIKTNRYGRRVLIPRSEILRLAGLEEN